ncbi:transport protein Sec23 [Brevipalpus obovatus]|uniref:transport protein Sec23 n=1 Tax=Brevipalpus obovatus TaxID=246614 RepID=UPI003D9F0AE8
MATNSFQEFLEGAEDVDGVRLNWNLWPMSKVEAAKIVLPLGCLYTPLKESTTRPLKPVDYDPLLCTRSQCRAVLNPFCNVDNKARIWTCAFCFNRNAFPALYNTIQDLQQLPEKQSSTLDYRLMRNPVSTPPIFLYVVDTCVDEEELMSLKSSIQASFAALPQNALIGLITYDRIVSLWELNTPWMKSFVFQGSKDYTAKQIQEWLGITVSNVAIHPQATHPGGHPRMPPGQQAGMTNLPKNNTSKFLQPVSECASFLTDILDQLKRDQWPTPQGKRSLRSTGAALSIAVSFLEITYPNSGARIMNFIGGPCTFGPGMIIDDDLKNTIRSHHDIESDHAKYMKKAVKHFQSLATRADTNGHTIDIYSCCLDQTGLHEMKCCANLTGGHIIMGDTFDSSLFKTSFQRVFDKNADGNLKMAFNAILDVKTTRELKISGAIGPCVSLGTRNQYVSDTEIGVGGTSQWKFCSLTPNMTTAIYFDVVASASQTGGAQASQGCIQFINQYQSSDGYQHIRVTTISRNMGTNDYAFDQEAAAVLLARLACHRAEVESNGPDVLRWLDRNLIRLCQRFGEFHKDSPDSFRLPPNFTMFPQFMFHLRRSQFIQVFNNSPDETSFYRHSLLRGDCYNSLIMIQPMLVSYSFYEAPHAALLDTSSIQPDRILLMDTFFHIVIFHGQSIAEWRKAGYQNQEGYESFKMLLDAPINDANELMMNRFPLPRYIVCDQHSSQARFLLSKVNPSSTHNTPSGYYGDGATAPVLTDDVSLQTFMEHLKKLVVTSGAT